MAEVYDVAPGAFCGWKVIALCVCILTAHKVWADLSLDIME
jgi:hypothetical protein